MFKSPALLTANLWRNRSLLWQFTVRNVEIRHKGSHLGLIWSLLNPLLMLGLYVVVFGYIFGGKFGEQPNETRADYALGIFLGLTVFQIVAEVLAVSPMVVTSQPNFVKKVIFPLEILPASAVGGAAFHMLISLGLVLLGTQLLGVGLHWGALWLPVILLPLVLLCLGLSWFVSAIGIFFRDIGQMMQFTIMVLMYASGVFYSAEKVFPHAAWIWLRFNPILLAIELARDTALWAQPLNFHHLGYLYACGLAALALGATAFQRLRGSFADVL